MQSFAETRHKVTWLELFYDLVYVATIIQLANVLSHDLSWGGVLSGAPLRPIILVGLVAALCVTQVALSWRVTHGVADLVPAPGGR